MATECKSLFRQFVSLCACIARILLFLLCQLLFMAELIAIYHYFKITTLATAVEIDIFHYTFLYYAQFTLLAVVALMGASGAYTKNPKYLTIFALIIAVCSVSSLLVETFVVSQRQIIKSNVEKFEKELEELVGNYQFDVDSKAEPNRETKIWDLFQNTLECCGMDGPENWNEWLPSEEAPLTVPNSCCNQGPKNAFLSGNDSQVCQINDQRDRQDGCIKELKKIMTVTFLSLIDGTYSDWIMPLLAVLLAIYYKLTTGGVADSNCCARTDNSNSKKLNRQTAAGPTAPTADMYPNAYRVEMGPVTPPPV